MAVRKPTRWDVARELRLWLWKPGAVAAGVLALGVLALRFDLGVGPPITWVGVLALVGLTAWWVWDRLLRPLDSEQRVIRAKEHANHNGGAASLWDLGQHASASAMRRRAPVLRPSLAREPDLLWRLPTTAYAVKVAVTGWALGPLAGHIGVWSSCEDTTLRIGGPRTGKTGSLSNHVLDAPGAVLCTSTRSDILEATGAQRADLGTVIVFNPTGLGDIPSTMRWTPLIGCDDYPTAQRRAASMIPEREGDARTWSDQGRRVLAVLLHAAARKRARLQKVADWVADPSSAAMDEIIAALHGVPNALALVAEVRQFGGTNDRTRTSITTTIALALQWLANARCAEVGDAPLDEAEAFDLRPFVERGRDSLYLIGSPEGSAVTPLISALTAEVAHQLRMVAGRRPAGRLDPPATLVLDEMALACPEIPIDQWTADMGGRGVTIHMSLQSLAQLRLKWGKDAAAAILNNVGTLLVFGGTKDEEDLGLLSNLTGQRLEQVDEDDRRYTVVLDGANIAALPMGEVMVVSRGIRPVLGTAPQVWNRRPPRRAPGEARVPALARWAARIPLLGALR